MEGKQSSVTWDEKPSKQAASVGMIFQILTTLWWFPSDFSIESERKGAERRGGESLARSHRSGPFRFGNVKFFSRHGSGEVT